MSELVSFTHQGLSWQVLPGYRDQLFAGGELPLAQWLAQGQARIIKQAPHRTIFHVTLPGLSCYIKHYPLQDVRSWFRQLVRPAKARTEYRRALDVARCGVPTFVPLALGERLTLLGTGESYLVTRELDGAEPLQYFLDHTLPTRSGCQRSRLCQDIARELGRLLAHMHDAGIRHDDLHAGNLLIRLDTDSQPHLFLIDLHAVQLGPALSWPRRRDNLVLINRFFSWRASRADRLRFWKAYCVHSVQGGWKTPAQGNPSFRAQLKRAAREVEQRTWESNLSFWRKLDRRCLGTNRYFRRLSEASAVGHVSANLDPAFLESLLADPDEPFARDNAVFLKNSRSSTVIELMVRMGQTIRPMIYKRFRVTTWSDPLAALVRPAPALRSWKFGHALSNRSLPTPKPLLVLHRRRRGLCYEGYLLTEKISDALDLHSFLQRLALLPPAQRRAWLWACIDRVASVVRQLHRCQLSHRDLKAANVLVTGLPPAATDPSCPALTAWLIDLVGMERWARLPWSRRLQNLTRLHASFVNSPYLSRADKLRFLRVYLQWGLKGPQDWKTWWRAIAQGTQAKVAANLRRGRPLA